MLKVFLGKGDARELLAHAVRQVWGLETLPEMTRLPEGKPVFAGLPGCHFNFSHSGGLVLCALSDRPVGADIEVIRPRRPGLPAYVLKGADYDRYLALGGDWAAFCVLWTEKESILKYTGEGLRALWRCAPPQDCTISYLSGEGWRGAVCAHEEVSAFKVVSTGSY